MTKVICDLCEEEYDMDNCEVHKNRLICPGWSVPEYNARFQCYHRRGTQCTKLTLCVRQTYKIVRLSHGKI